jgi:hypothetical protein
MKIHKIMALMKRNLVSSLGLYFLANSNAMICLFDYFPSKQIVDQAKKILTLLISRTLMNYAKEECKQARSGACIVPQN